MLYHPSILLLLLLLLVILTTYYGEKHVFAPSQKIHFIINKIELLYCGKIMKDRSMIDHNFLDFFLL